jgi:flagellar capping protein FliD
MSIRLGGLISSMDTQATIDKLMEAARKPLETLSLRKTKLELKKSTFQNIDSQLTKLQKSLLDLRLESTFKSKKVASSDDRYITGQAAVSAAPGSHSISISQVATPAVIRSQYARTTLSSSPANTAGISSITGRPLETMEGNHEIAITNEGSYYRARSLFKPSGAGQLQTLTGSVAESGSMEGTIAQNIGTGSNKLVLTVNGEEVTVFLDDATANATTMARVAADAEDKINAALNLSLDTQNISYVAVRSSRDAVAGTDAFTVYNVSGNNSLTVNTAQTTAAALGFSSGGTSGASSALTTDVTSTTLTGLLIEMNEPETGLIRGVSFRVISGTGLQLGEALIHASPSLNAVGPSKSRVDGAEGVSSSGTLNLTAAGLNNAGFANTPSTATNGTFSINGVRITIANYSTARVNDVLSMINGSAAGVTASYDSTNDRIMLASREYSSASITLGDPTDTSDFLTIAKLTANQGASFSPGSSTTSISTGSSLSRAGFTLSPTSGTFTINGISLFVNTATESMDDLITKINNSGANVTARYDTLADKFVLSSTMGKVDSNNNKITLGQVTDSSNILRALNLVGEEYATVTTALAPSGNRSTDTITITNYGLSLGTDVSVPATTATAAYQVNAGTVNWIDGIAQGAVFNLLAGDDGITASTWTNNSGAVISSIDAFVSAWNNSANWSSSRVEIGVIKEGADKLRFFSRPTTAGASSNFTVTAPSAFDLYELGLATDGSLSQTFSNAAATADAQYNAMNLVYAINSTSGLGVKAATDGSGHVTFTSTTQGYGGGFTLSDESTEPGNTILDYFGSSSVSVRIPENQEKGFRGRDAAFTVDGTSYTRTTNMVDDVVDGLTMNLYAPTTTPVTLTITNETDRALDKLADFIVSYNETISKLNPPALTDEQKLYLDPLSDDDQAKMTSTQIDKYEELYDLYNGYEFIRREGSLRMLSSSIRSNTTGEVSNLSSFINDLQEIGIEPGSIGGFNDARDGYLLLAPTGQDDYREAVRSYLESNADLLYSLQNNADGVYKLFANQGTGNEENGIARKLDDLINDYTGTDGILDDQIRIGGSIDDQVSKMEDRIASMEESLLKQEDRLWEEFNRMEQELARLNAQSSTLASLLSSLSTSSS